MLEICTLREKLFLRRVGGRVVSHEEAEAAYRDGKIVNLARYCPEVFNSDD
ncbi:MAG TPA: hypothetical protein O0X42_02090 [Methanocorpusculum sp.]|nr:hypothetical protein [Methanocorpusculum sp.]